MKPAHPYQPPYQPVRGTHAESVMLGVGGTLLVAGTAVLALLLLFVLPAVHRVVSEVFGSGMDRFRMVAFLTESRGVVLVGVIILEAALAAAFLHTRRPGLGLLVEGIVLLTFSMLLVMVVWAEASHAISSLAGSVDAARMKPLPPL